MSDFPNEHVVDAHKLVADGIVFLFEIEFVTGGKMYLKANDTVTWLGRRYEGTAISITGVEKYSDGKQSRPQLVMANPNSIYNEFIKEGLLEYAKVRRIKVLRENLLANRDIKEVQSWRIWRVVAHTNEAITCELRGLTDRFNALIPGRMFTPPDFPLVTLQ